MTGLYCCDCGRELEHNEDVTVIAGAYIEYEFGEYVTMPTNEPNFSTLCKDCSGKVLNPKPNLVVVQGLVSEVWAKHPAELIVTISEPIMGLWEPGIDSVEDGTVFGGPDGLPIKQLNTAKEL